MAVSSPEWVVLGKFGRPQGVKGLVRVVSYTEPSENIFSYPNWFVQQQGKPREIKRSQDTISPKHLLTQIEGCVDRTGAESLTNAFILVPQDALPRLEEGAYYWHQLVGMQVIHETGATLGTVDSVFSTGANDVLVVQGERRRLIPYLLDDVIQEVNEDRREITVSWDLDF